MIDAFLAFLTRLLFPSKNGGRSYTAQEIKNLIYSQAPAGMNPELVFTQAALEIGIENYTWKPGATFLRTRSLFNRHVGSGKGFWTQEVHIAGRAGDEQLRVYESPAQSLRDYGQLMSDPLYRDSLASAQGNHRAGFFRALTTAGFEGPHYEEKLERRWKTLKNRGVI